MKKNVGMALSGNSFIADVYWALGEWETAFVYYDRAISNRKGHMIWKKQLFGLVPNLMEDLRIKVMFQKMNVIY